MIRGLAVLAAIQAIAHPRDLAARIKAHKSPPIDAGHPYTEVWGADVLAFISAGLN